MQRVKITIGAKQFKRDKQFYLTMIADLNEIASNVIDISLTKFETNELIAYRYIYEIDNEDEILFLTLKYKNISKQVLQFT